MSNRLEFMDVFKSDMANSWMENTMQQHYKLIVAKKDDLIRQKLKEKGFEYLVEGIGKRKFPKIMRIIQNEWEYIYADNDTDEGAFIVAIKDNFKNDFYNSEPYKITYEFQWQDKFPIVEYKQL